MPPKKILKLGKDGKVAVGEPRVILRPLRADSSGHSRYRYTTHAPTSNLFNKPDLSDIKLKVGDQTFYAHRLVLCSASDVFAKMLGPDWIESLKNELTLQEEEECVKVFDRFLYFFYSGSIIISDSYVIPLFMLADKYNVSMLYDECVKVIENGLKVYIVTKSATPGCSDNSTPRKLANLARNNSDMYNAGPSSSNVGASYSASSSSYSDSSSDSDSSTNESPLSSKIIRYTTSSSVTPQGSMAPGDGHTHKPVISRSVKHLVASETFPLALVMKMLAFCQNERISNAALYNLEARLCNQIFHNNFGVWNDLPQSLLVRMLEDDFFYCNEYFLFCAAKSWLCYKVERKTEEILTDVLCNIRFAILTSDQLYDVERDAIIGECPEACKLVREAVRYQLFQNCSKAKSEENWSGKQFEYRKVKEI